MSSFKCPEGFVDCPYDRAHVVLIGRLQPHIVKCKLNHGDSKLVECPFNSTHLVPEIELNCHKTYLCSDRKKLDTFIYSTENTTPLFPVQQLKVESSENWDDVVQVPTYDPNKLCKEKKVLMTIQGATPSLRKAFRAEERQRHELFDVGPSTSQEPITENIPLRLPKTQGISHFNNLEPSVPKESRGRGRGRCP